MFLMNVKSQDAEVVKKMNIVIFDGYTINPGDLSWDKLDALCDKLTVFDSTSEDKALSRLTGNEILMTSKCPITRELMENSPQLKYIGCTATGYNNIDVEAAADLGIAVTNIPAYSTDAVAQHTIALMLELSNHVGLHNASVQDGQWSDNEYFCYPSHREITWYHRLRRYRQTSCPDRPRPWHGNQYFQPGSSRRHEIRFRITSLSADKRKPAYGQH